MAWVGRREYGGGNRGKPRQNRRVRGCQPTGRGIAVVIFIGKRAAIGVLGAVENMAVGADVDEALQAEGAAAHVLDQAFDGGGVGAMDADATEAVLEVAAGQIVVDDLVNDRVPRAVTFRRN